MSFERDSARIGRTVRKGSSVLAVDMSPLGSRSGVRGRARQGGARTHGEASGMVGDGSLERLQLVPTWRRQLWWAHCGVISKP